MKKLVFIVFVSLYFGFTAQAQQSAKPEPEIHAEPNHLQAPNKASERLYSLNKFHIDWSIQCGVGKKTQPHLNFDAVVPQVPSGDTHHFFSSKIPARDVYAVLQTTALIPCGEGNVIQFTIRNVTNKGFLVVGSMGYSQSQLFQVEGNIGHELNIPLFNGTM